jgi:hypothetical protein
MTALTTTVTFQVKIQTGTPSGTMFASVFSASGDPKQFGSAGDCAGKTLLATSNTIDAAQLTSSLQLFNFTFTTQQALMQTGQLYIVAVAFSLTGGTAGTLTGTGSASPLLNEQHEALSPDGGTTWNTGLPRCDSSIPSNGVCETYTLSGINQQGNGSPSPSPYGTNPVYYPCNNFPSCGQVSATALQGSSLRVSDIPPDPFVWLFIIFALLTIGAYIVIRTNTTSKRNPRQYELSL